jgi:hypothetical protein
MDRFPPPKKPRSALDALGTKIGDFLTRGRGAPVTKPVEERKQDSPPVAAAQPDRTSPEERKEDAALADLLGEIAGAPRAAPPPAEPVPPKGREGDPKPIVQGPPKKDTPKAEIKPAAKPVRSAPVAPTKAADDKPPPTVAKPEPARKPSSSRLGTLGVIQNALGIKHKDKGVPDPRKVVKERAKFKPAEKKAPETPIDTRATAILERMQIPTVVLKHYSPELALQVVDAVRAHPEEFAALFHRMSTAVNQLHTELNRPANREAVDKAGDPAYIVRLMSTALAIPHLVLAIDEQLRQGTGNQQKHPDEMLKDLLTGMQRIAGTEGKGKK